MDADGFVPCTGDCDDTNEDSHPGAPELYDGNDNSCDGDLTLDEADVDGDGFLACADDGDDDNDDVSPAAAENTEGLCNDGIDNDCDGREDVREDDCDDFFEDGPGSTRTRGCAVGGGGSSLFGLVLLLGWRRRP